MSAFLCSTSRAANQLIDGRENTENDFEGQGVFFT
jgi:hypothetical protein